MGRPTVVRAAMRRWSVCCSLHSRGSTTERSTLESPAASSGIDVETAACSSLHFLKRRNALEYWSNRKSEQTKWRDLTPYSSFDSLLSWVCVSERNLNEILSTQRSNQASGQWWGKLLCNLNSNLHANSMKMKRTHFHSNLHICPKRHRGQQQGKFKHLD